jgi:DNA-binding MarR family transcriptional regulator
VKNLNEAMTKMAKELKRQHHQLTMNTFLSLLVCSDIIYRYLDSERDEKEITGAGFNVLNTLILCNGSAFPTEISKWLFRSKHSVSKVIFTLERHGLVTINQVREDRRRREVRITEKGIEAARRGTIYLRKRVGEEIFKILTDKETKVLNDILLRLRKHTLTLVDFGSR